MQKLHSQRLILRPFKITDAERLARITNDPLVLRNLLRTSYPFTIHKARQTILRLRKKRLPVWAIDDGQVVGLIGLVGEFGLWLGRSAWRKGYGEEAGRLVINHAFSHMKVRRLEANPIFDNRASHHLLEKLDFREVGRSRALCSQRQTVVSLRRYKLDRTETKA